jgi:hypothetical protein
MGLRLLALGQLRLQPRRSRRMVRRDPPAHPERVREAAQTSLAWSTVPIFMSHPTLLL